MNNSSWWLNPRFAIACCENIQSTVVLVQDSDARNTGNEADVKPIGVYVTRSDDNLDPCLDTENDIIVSSPFEPAIDGKLHFYSIFF